MPRPLFSLLMLLCCASVADVLHAERTAATRPAPGEQVQPSQPLDREQLAVLYRQALGKAYEQDQFGALAAAHRLIEDFFAADTSADRERIVEQLQQSTFSPDILGRLVRLRMHWPALRGGVYYINERVGPHQVMYFVGVPADYDPTRTWPLVIKLPGAHAFVTEPRPGPVEVSKLYSDWIEDELDAHPDAIVLMPRLNLDELWGPSYLGMNSVVQPMLHVAGRLNIEPSRVYLGGQGMSAHAVWNIALHYPTYFAAINPMAGGATADYQRVRLVNLRNVLVVAWHDAQDPLVRVELTRELVRALRASEYDVDYEETSGIGHAPSEQLAHRMYDKFRARQRELYPRQVTLASNRPDALFNRNDWVRVFQPLSTGEEQRVRWRHGSGTAMIHGNPHSITASITEPNCVEVQSRNVESMRFYFNDQMVDFARPVTIAVNGKIRFQGLLTPSVETMLTDQLFLGRGWRYYTAFVDIDFGAQQPASTHSTTQPVE